MEDEGICYFFAHDRKKHTLVLADSPEAHRPCPEQPEARYEPEGGEGEREDVITTWNVGQEFRPSVYTLRDYHHEMSQKPLEVSSTTTVDRAVKTPFEIYDYPGNHATPFNKPGERLTEVESEGGKIAKLRTQESDALMFTINGTSECRAFTAGYRFTLKSPPAGISTGPYVLTSVQHTATQGSDFVSGPGTEVFYSNTFTCIPRDIPFRPERVTPKPVMQGPQTAMVVGIKGKEIDCDKYGRIKVQFPWDREGNWDENSSCWIRVSHAWAGKGWGGFCIPRVGQKVIVDFLEGDPDQPIITGRVYNADSMPPYPLPAGAMVSGLKSNSTPGGGGSNEISLNDTKGNEGMFIHAQYNSDTVIGNNRTTQVGVDSFEKVGNNVQIQVGNNQQETIGNNQMVNVGNSVVINAGTSITLQCGASRIHMNKAGFITITGTVITTAAAVNASVSAPLTEIVGGVLLTEMGGVTLIQGGVTQVRGKVTTVQGSPVKINC